jgi:CubicO group peptidase (beta-lactamase class C family)
VRTHKSVAAALGLAAVCSLAAAVGVQDSPSATPLKLDTRKDYLITDLQRVVQDLIKRADVPGLSIALIRDGQVMWHHGFGVANADTGQPVSDSSVFEAASLSKPVFAYAVLKLVDAGKLDLDTPLTKYMPGAYVENDDRLNLITARIVLSHRTGFPNWRPDGQPLKIHFRPGEKFSYSGEGIVYLQKVVEHITGESLDAVMTRLVFDPLQMTSSSYVWQEKFDTLKVFGHNSIGKVGGRNKPDAANAAASLNTTALDYARFVAAIMNGTGLKKATIEQMLTPEVKLDETCVNCLGPMSGKLSESLGWGLGWGLQQTADGLSFWHWGDNGNAKAFVVGFEKQKLGVVIFANGSNGLSIAPEIVAAAVGGKQPALAWLKYEPYDSPARRLLKDIVARGGDALRDYREAKEKNASIAITESQMNRIGYDLLGLKRVKEAVEAFKLNVADFPKSSNVYDSLGEAYAIAGQKELAIFSYKKSLELDPANANGAQRLKQLEAPAARVDPALYDAYTGQYEAPFGVLTIIRDGNKLLAGTEGKADQEMVPQSATSFTVPGVKAEVTFVKDQNGRVTHITIKMKGEETQAKKIQ